MGRVPGSKNSANKKKKYKKASKTWCRNRDIDQIQDDLRKEIDSGTKMSFEEDDNLPGLGNFYCVYCARHFADLVTLDRHKLTKAHKRRLKDVKQETYSQEVADYSAGKTKESLTQVRVIP